MPLAQVDLVDLLIQQQNDRNLEYINKGINKGLTLNEITSYFLIEKIEKELFHIDPLYIKILDYKDKNGDKKYVSRRFTDDNFNFNLSIKDLILSPSI